MDTTIEISFRLQGPENLHLKLLDGSARFPYRPRSRWTRAGSPSPPHAKHAPHKEFPLAGEIPLSKENIMS